MVGGRAGCGAGCLSAMILLVMITISLFFEIPWERLFFFYSQCDIKVVIRSTSIARV